MIPSGFIATVSAEDATTSPAGSAWQSMLSDSTLDFENGEPESITTVQGSVTVVDNALQLASA